MNILSKIKTMNMKLCTKYVSLKENNVCIEQKKDCFYFDETKVNDYLFSNTKYYKKIVCYYDNDYERIVLGIKNKSILNIYDKLHFMCIDPQYDYFYSINKIIKHIYGLEITPQEFDAILTMIEEVFNELFLIVQSQGSKAQYNDVLVSYISGFYSTKNLTHERGNALLDRDILNYCFTMTGYEWEGYKYIEYGKVFHDSTEKRGLKITGKNFLFEDLIDVLNTPSILSLFKNDIYNIESEKISLMFELSKEVFSFRQND